MHQLLNIITVTKDDINGVTATLESTVKFRNYSSVKQIVVDSSAEETKNKIRLLTESNERIDYIHQESAGIATAFNLGLSLVESEWVWFLNGGDQVHIDVEAEKILYFIRKSSADAIIFQLQRMNSGEIVKHPPLWAVWPPVKPWIPHPATITRKQLYREFGDFNESFDIAMDYEFWFRCFSKKVVVDMLSLPLVQFDTNGLSNTAKSKVNREAVRIVKMHFWVLMKLWFHNGIGALLTWKKFISSSK